MHIEPEASIYRTKISNRISNRKKFDYPILRQTPRGRPAGCMYSILDPILHYYHTAHSTSLHVGLIWLPYLAKGRLAPLLLKIWSPARAGSTYAHAGLNVTGALSYGQRSCFCSTNRAAPCASFALLWWPPPVATPRIPLTHYQNQVKSLSELCISVRYSH